MKILHIIDELLMGGAENLLIGLAGEQVVRGHDVTVVPLVCGDNTPVRAKMVEKGIKIKPLKDKGTDRNPWFVIRIIAMLSRYDIVHVHLFPSLYWAGFAKIFSFSRTPMVYTEHSTNNKRRGHFFLHITDRLVYQYGYNKIIACSEKALETFRKAYPTVSNACYINNGVDTSVFRDAKPYSKQELLGIDNDCFVVTMVARFMTMKRQDTIVEAITRLPETIHAVFVGGEETDEGLKRVKAMAVKMDVANRIHFLYIRNDVPRILKTSDVVIMASDYEGLSLSSIEGMAAGKPFVASNVNGLKEVVGGAGLLYENKDAEALAQIIGKLAVNKDYYKEIAVKCSQRAKAYDLKGMVDSYFKVYKEVIKN